MRIRNSARADLPAMAALWEEAFGRDPFCAAFFETLWQPERSLVALEGTKLLAMLHTVSYPLIAGAKTLRGEYLYGAATAKIARNQGLFTALHETLLRSCGADFLFLIPETDSLIPFYTARGYHPAFDAPLLPRDSAGEALSGGAQRWYPVYREALSRLTVPYLVLDEASFALTLSDKTPVALLGEDVPFGIQTPDGVRSFFPLSGGAQTKKSAMLRTLSGEIPENVILPYLLN